jgi:predicted HTH domain antitoxin
MGAKTETVMCIDNYSLSMDEITVKVPRDLVRILKVKDEELPKLVKLYLAVELYREGKISLGKATEIAGVTKWEMMEILASKGIPIQYDVKDLDNDVKTLEEML